MRTPVCTRSTTMAGECSVMVTMYQCIKIIASGKGDWPASGERRPGQNVYSGLSSQFCQQIRRMDGLAQDFELMSLGAGIFQQVGGGRLPGEEQDLAIR